MHLNLERLNLLLSGKATREERALLMEHILECDSCALKFRAFNDLNQRLDAAPRRRSVWKYALGAAAILLMTIYPYVSKKPERRPRAHSAEDFVPGFPDGEPRQLAVLDRIQEINFQAGVRDWGTNASLADLIRLRNRK